MKYGHESRNVSSRVTSRCFWESPYKQNIYCFDSSSLLYIKEEPEWRSVTGSVLNVYQTKDSDMKIITIVITFCSVILRFIRFHEKRRDIYFKPSSRHFLTIIIIMVKYPLSLLCVSLIQETDILVSVCRSSTSSTLNLCLSDRVTQDGETKIMLI